jgi:hypothetical protein
MKWKVEVGATGGEWGDTVSRPPFKDNSSPVKFLKRAPEITNVFIEFLWNLSISCCGCVRFLGFGNVHTYAGKIFAATSNQNAFFH